MRVTLWAVMVAALVLTGTAGAQYSTDPEKDTQLQRDESRPPDAAVPGPLDDSSGPGPIVATPGRVTLETIPAVTMVVLPMTGPYDQHEKALNRLMELVGPRGIVQGAPFGIYYSDPSQVPPDSLLWEVGVPVAVGTKVEGPFLVRNAAAMQAATVLCTGPFDKTEACFTALLDWIAKNGYTVVGPAQEHWLSDVKTVKPEKRQTRIVIPIAPAARPVR